MADAIDSSADQLGPVARTPLELATFSADGVVLGENRLCGKLVLRADFSDPSVAAAIDGMFSVNPDLAPNTYVENNQCTLFWLGPDERLIHLDEPDCDAAVSQLSAQLPAGKASVVDVTDYYTVIRVAGERARKVLATGTPFDLHARSFSDGQCAQTRFGHAAVLIALRDDSPAFDLQVRWSFADYVWKYLCRVSEMKD